MKSIITSLVLLTSFSATAAQIRGVQLKDSQSLSVTLSYVGGCKPHHFEFQAALCDRSLPANCVVEIVDTTQDDSCRATVETTIDYNLSEIPNLSNVNEVLFVGSSDTAVTVEI